MCIEKFDVTCPCGMRPKSGWTPDGHFITWSAEFRKFNDIIVPIALILLPFSVLASHSATVHSRSTMLSIRFDTWANIADSVDGEEYHAYAGIMPITIF